MVNGQVDQVTEGVTVKAGLEWKNGRRRRMIHMKKDKRMWPFL